MPNDNSRSDAPASRDANPGAHSEGRSEASLTRRQLRELRLAEAARIAQTDGETVVPDAAPAAVAPAPLTRRQLRDQEALERETQRALRAEEIATLEIAEIGTSGLEPDVALALEPVTPVDDNVVASAFEPEPALHIAPAVITSPVARPADFVADATGVLSADTVSLDLDSVPAEPIVTETMIVTSVTPEGARRPRRTSSAARTATASASARVARSTARATSVARADVAGAATSGASAPTSRRRRSWAKAGFSAVAMAFVVAMTAVTALPTTVSASPVDANVVNLSLSAGTSAQTQQLVTAGSASGAVDRDGYSVSDAGELQAAGYSTAQLLVGRSLAQELVNAMDSGKLVGSQPDHMKEIRWIAQGVTMPDCGVDYRILEIIAIAVRNFDQVGVSDINRKCTGQIEGAGTSSSHYIDGGGHAVDFYLLNNKSLNGADAGTLKMISLLDPVMPVGSRVGQASCRTSAGVHVNLTNWTEFDDSCTHMHVDVPVTDAPLLLSDSTLETTTSK